MNTPQIEQLQMFGAPQPHIFPDFCEWEFKDEPKATEERLDDLICQPSNSEEYRQLNLLTSTLEPSSLDRPQFSICPSCASQVIKIADGCGICGWSEGEKLLGGEEKLSIPCLVKQPLHPEVKGVIKEDLGDRFLVEVANETISVSKLFVYPDFDNCSFHTTAETNKKVSDTSGKCSSKILTPSKKSSSKTRRRKGEGSGAIFYRTVTRNGRDYQQAYYHWRENGKQRTKYIPKKLLDRVQSAESEKLPVADILELLQGGLKKCSSKKFDTFSNEEVLTKDESAKTIPNCSSKITSPPSKRQKRPSGYGGGYIEYREVKRNHKTYSQYWYHYEFWRSGDHLTKKSSACSQAVSSEGGEDGGGKSSSKGDFRSLN